MKRIVFSALLASIVLFLWGFIYWSVLPTRDVFRAWKDSNAVAETLLEEVPAAGVYALPDPHLMTNDLDAYSSAHERGPVAMIFVHPQGRPAMPPTVFFFGWLQMFIACLGLAWLLDRAVASLHSFGARWVFVCVAVEAAIFLIAVGTPIWWNHPWGFHLVNIGFYAIGGVLVAAVLAKMIPGPQGAV